MCFVCAICTLSNAKQHMQCKLKRIQFRQQAMSTFRILRDFNVKVCRKLQLQRQTRTFGTSWFGKFAFFCLFRTRDSRCM